MTKLTDTLVDKIQNIAKIQDNLKAQLGDLAADKVLLDEQYERVSEQYRESIREGKKIMSDVHLIYGKGTLNIENKTFTPEETEDE